MTEEIKIALIVAIPPTLLALASLITSMRHREQDKADHAELHLQINSRMDELLELTRKDSFREGKDSR